MVKESGGEVAKDYAVLDVYRRYKQFKPQGIAELNAGGQQLAQALAKEIAQDVDGLIGQDAAPYMAPLPHEGSQHG
jgi:hypothetical protein